MQQQARYGIQGTWKRTLDLVVCESHGPSGQLLGEKPTVPPTSAFEYRDACSLLLVDFKRLGLAIDVLHGARHSLVHVHLTRRPPEQH